MARPPVPPPNLPTLSAMQRPTGPDDAEDGGPPSGVAQKGAAILRIFHEVSQKLDAIASAVPGQSEALDEIKTRLSDVMTAIVNGGSKSPNSTPSDDTGGPMPVA